MASQDNLHCRILQMPSIKSYCTEISDWSGNVDTGRIHKGIHLLRPAKQLFNKIKNDLTVLTSEPRYNMLRKICNQKCRGGGGGGGGGGVSWRNGCLSSTPACQYTTQGWSTPVAASQQLHTTFQIFQIQTSDHQPNLPKHASYMNSTPSKARINRHWKLAGFVGLGLIIIG